MTKNITVSVKNNKAKGKLIAKGKTNSNKPQKASKNVAAKAKPEKIGVDKFGSRIGSNRAILNAALSVKPRTAREIMERAGLTRPKTNHLNALIGKGLLKKDKEGKYLLAK